MKHLRYLIFLAFTSSVMGFFPRTYQQAEIFPGELNLTLSTSIEIYGYCFFDNCVQGYGQNLQLTGRWASKSWESFAFIGCIGSLFSKGFGFRLWDFEPVDSTRIGFVPNIGLGLHWEFVERPTFAVQLSAEFPSLISVTFLSGINSRKLNREIVTIGLKTIPGPVDFLPIIPAGLFVNVHPTPRLHVMGGVTYLYMTGGEIHLGLGYTFGRLGEVK